MKTMMKLVCLVNVLACLASCQQAVAQDLNVREFRRSVEVGDVSKTDRLPWYAGESIGYSVLARSMGRAVQIPAGSVPVWLVMASTSAPPYVVSTGTVVSATNGEVRFWLPAPQANLPAGDYLSFATVYQGTNRVGVLDRATVRVSWRPGDAFEVAQPLTNVIDQVISWWADANALVAAASNGLSLAISSAAAGVQDNLTAHASNTSNPHGVTPAQIGAATGNPVYVETDAAGLAAAAGVQDNLTAHASNTSNPHGVTPAQIGAATGNPVYVETDAAGLAAAAGVQGNLTAHAGNTNNPHGVTAAQIGAIPLVYRNLISPPAIYEFFWEFDGYGVKNLTRNYDIWGGAVQSRSIDFFTGAIYGNWTIYDAILYGPLTISGPAANDLADFVDSRLAAATPETFPQQLALADGFVTIWSTGKWAQAYTAAPGAVATVRAVRAAASLTNAVAPIPFWLCCGTNFISFRTNNLLGFSVSQVATNGATNLFLLDAMPGSTNFNVTKIR
jgi:hypothetical protein